MRRFGTLAGALVLGGVGVLLPVLLLYLGIAELLQLLVAMATPIADLLFPPEVLESVHAPEILAVLLLLGLSVVLGLAAQTQAGYRLGRWTERNTLARLPMYAALKSLANRLLGRRESESFIPILLAADDGSSEIAYVVEDHGDEFVTVLVPWAPTPFAGWVKIVPRERLRQVDANFAEVTRVLSQWGVGTRALLGQGGVSPRLRSEKQNGE